MSGKINPAALQEVAADLGIDPLVLERDWVLTEIIYHLAQQSVGQDLVLKGGQALRHVYGSERFSKDADYVARRRIEFEELRELLDIRYPALQPPASPAGRTKFGLKIDPIHYTGPLKVRGTVEVEVSFREEVQRETQTMRFVSPFREPFTVAVMDLHEMVSEKIRALYQRGNPRDLYDLWFIFSKVYASIDDDTVAQLVPLKFQLVSKGWKRQELYTNIRANEAAWNDALTALVADPPEFDDALSVVERALRPIINKIKG